MINFFNLQTFTRSCFVSTLLLAWGAGARADCSLLPANLTYPDSPAGECLDARKVEGFGNETILSVEFWNGEEGTSVLVNERRFGLFNLKEKKWIVEPFTLERTLRSAQSEKKIELAQIEWTKGKQISLFKKDLQTKKSVKIWPIEASSKR